MKAYKLKFHSSFHIDAGSAVDGPSETFIRSDTLFSAIVSASRKFYENDIAEKFLRAKSLVLSSAFPFYKDEFFFPKPLNFFPETIKDYSQIKIFKKIKFISKDLLLKVISGSQIEDEFFNTDYVLNDCLRSIPNAKTENENKKDKIFKKSENPHIVVDRISNSTQIFHKTEIYFNKNAGLFFIAESDENILNEFEAVLNFLGDEGIGADRTIGKGSFEVEKVNLDLSANTESDAYYSLSLYSPSKEEFEQIAPEKSYYDFVLRCGWISNKTLSRKTLRMFSEGSVLKIKSKQKPSGIVHKVLNKEEYPELLTYDIYRSGQTLFLPMMGGLNDNN